ncbi:MAG: methyltransferase domain-containing protein [Bryobacteraceae bacterium]
MPVPSYYASRECLNYYAVCGDLVKERGFACRSILDVGSADVPFVEWFDWIADRVTVDQRDREGRLGSTHLQADFRSHQFNRTFDLVTCMQVLEHLHEVEPFARKLFTLSNRFVLISVPYKWPQGRCRFHVQDPVDKESLLRWTGRTPEVEIVVNDERTERLVSWYQIN